MIKKEDILEALGLQQDTVGTWLTPMLVGFGVGALVGAGVALMMAPKAGNELREEILERGRRIVEKGRDKMGNVQMPST